MSKINAKNKHTGSSFDSFLKEEDIYDEVLTKIKEKSSDIKRRESFEKKKIKAKKNLKNLLNFFKK